MDQTYDAAVIGAGHNGLVAAAYLARAGRSVVVLERRDIVGGACVTEEFTPGFKVSTAAYSLSLLQPRIIADLRLKQFGLSYYAKDPAMFLPLPDGRRLILWRDTAASQREIAKFSGRDAEAYPRFEAFLDRVAEILRPVFMSPPQELEAVIGGLGPGDRADVDRVLTASAADLLDDFFESEVLKGAFATQGVIGTLAGPRTPGTAFVLAYHEVGELDGLRGAWGYVRGGMGSVTGALARAAEYHGARIEVNAEVARILVQAGQAAGVELMDGRKLRAGAVFSNADPKRTFLRLLDKDDLAPEFRQKVKAIRMDGCVMKINCAMAELPDYLAMPGAGPGPQHTGTVDICPSIDYLEAAFQDARQGRPSSRPFMEVYIQSATDPTLAPPGRHVMSIFAQYAPYSLAEGSWRERGDDFADVVLDTLAEYAPNVKDSIIARQALSPADLEDRFFLTGGHIFHGEMLPGQLFQDRPAYRTPIPGLYLCGAGTHPGGGVAGAPGYNAAACYLADSSEGIR